MSKELLEILACPVCKNDIVYNEEKQTLICTFCHKQYPIREGIPVMLEEEAIIEEKPKP
ncbi:MAG: Trm112 family protein [bacterium]|nr:Trm112 family protein [bacterium]